MDDLTPALEMRFMSSADQLQVVRAEVRRALANLGYSADQLNCIVLAVNEACMNIIQHAYGATRRGEIILEMFIGPNDIIFRLTDFAAPVDKGAIRSRELDEIRPGGLGVHLMSQVMDLVDFRNDPEGIGNILVMRKQRPRG
jgi:sigma-B regulation protein RsbU (phosphoserine phosphatase)